MLKIKLVELFRHRNETTFRPYVNAAGLFEDIGIQFVVDGNYDMAWVGQASFSDKNHPYQRSVSRGKWFLDRVAGDVVLFDGQDSASLMGSHDALLNSNALALMKNTMYAVRSEYQKPYVHGRSYWGSAMQHGKLELKKDTAFGENAGAMFGMKGYDYFIDLEIDPRVRLSGTNWLSTINPHWYGKLDKDIDVFAMFAYPAKFNLEFDRPTNFFYDFHREKCVNWLDVLPRQYKVSKIENGVKVPIEEYYARMRRSKIVVAPFGYGEMAPRDIEAAMVGAVLIKPDMGHIESIPNVYVPNETYRPCKWDYSDLNEIIEDTLLNYAYWQDKLVTGMRERYAEQYDQEKMVTYMYNFISELPGYGV